MLYVLHGDDFEPIRAKQKALIEALHTKRPNAEVFMMDDMNFNTADLQEFIGGRGLFENKYIVVLDRCFSDTDAKKAILDRIEEIAGSPHAFLLIEEVFTAPDQKAATKHAQQVWQFDKKAVEEDEYKIFSLTDAFGARKKAGVWIEYQRALRAGERPESIHGMLFWQIKLMLLTHQTSSPKEAGVSPYPYKKASQFQNNFTYDELKDLSTRLVAVLHESRSGRYDLREGLEQLLLEI